MSASYRITPSDHTSLRPSMSASPLACSGLMYAGDPRTAPVVVFTKTERSDASMQTRSSVSGSVAGGSWPPLKRAFTRPTMPGAAGFETSNVPGLRSALASTGT